MNRIIRKVAVLGSGVMGSRIACHFANIGVKVLLLDIVPKELNDAEKAKGLTVDSPAYRNRIVNADLASTISANPEALYHKGLAKNIRTGNFDDNMQDIADCDWILEAVIENLDIKKSVFEKVEKHRKTGAIVSSNTSGIPIHLMLEGRSEDFQKNFIGTHFFNPPRYLRLLEIIPTAKTDPELTAFLMHYGDLFLGKTTVLCKDTPAFIANRIGVFSIMAIFQLLEQMDLTVDDVDMLTGPVSGRPKSATFRTCDVVGLDTLVKVANNAYQDCKDDEQRDIFKIPAYVQKMVDQKWLGDKTGQGFYKKTKDENGKKVILTLNLKTLEYEPKKKNKFASVETAKPYDDLKKRIQVLHTSKDKGAEFTNKLTQKVASYCSFRIPEISDTIYQIDDALKAGFGWELGPFENWDVLGVETLCKAMQEANVPYAKWIDDMLAAGCKSFYRTENNQLQCYDIATKSYKTIAGKDSFIILENYKPQQVLWHNNDSSIIDIGDGIINIEFHTKMNAIGAGIIEGMNKAFDMAEAGKCQGIIIANEATNFSAGANLMFMMMQAFEEEWDELNFAIRAFQNTMMRVRYNPVPTIVAPRGLALGGGCEMTMHADSVQAAAETYIGLVEVGVGLIPAGGGTKETVKRISDNVREGDVIFNRLQQGFINIATAKVATSAENAYDLNILTRGKDHVTLNLSRQIIDAKNKALQMIEDGYTPLQPANDIQVMGRSALGALLSGAASFNIAGYATAHDRKIAEKLAYVMCGGDLSTPTLVSEQYLLDLEREAFLSLLGEKKTLERIQSVLTTGKPLRN